MGTKCLRLSVLLWNGARCLVPPFVVLSEGGDKTPDTILSQSISAQHFGEPGLFPALKWTDFEQVKLGFDLLGHGGNRARKRRHAAECVGVVIRAPPHRGAQHLLTTPNGIKSSLEVRSSSRPEPHIRSLLPENGSFPTPHLFTIGATAHRGA